MITRPWKPTNCVFPLARTQRNGRDRCGSYMPRFRAPTDPHATTGTTGSYRSAMSVVLARVHRMIPQKSLDSLLRLEGQFGDQNRFLPISA